MVLRATKLILLLFLSLFFVETVVTYANNSKNGLFPSPAILKPNIEFWIDVYSKYSERQVIIHDSWNLGIVYEIVHLDSLFKGAHVSNRIESKKIEQIKKDYKRVLLKLARKNKIHLSALHGKEKRVAALFGPGVTAKQLRTAAKRIRGQNGLKERFEQGMVRTGLYARQMQEIFTEADLPLELLALPHVESSYNYKAYSKLGAAGLWQFTRSTGRMYMKINYNIDERLDPLIATRSAAKLLKANQQALGAWPLAITAYNHGRNGMKRAKRKFGNDIGKISRYYRSRSFGFASRNFYAEFLAALHVSSNYKKYFGEIQFLQPLKYLEFDLPDYVTVKALINKLGISHEEFAELNPALRRPVLQSRRRIPKRFQVRVPFKDNLDMERMYAQISSKFKFKRQVTPDWHKVRGGENLSRIARRYQVPLRELMALNNIHNAHRIYAGQNLQIPESQQGIRSSLAVRKVKVEKEIQLADATDLIKKERGVLDIPRSVQVASLPSGTDEPAGDQSPVAMEMEYVTVRPGLKADAPKEAETLAPVAVAKIESQYQSVEEVMAMALPGHHVELTRDMGMRVVRAPKVESVHEAFRDIDMPQNGQVVVEPDETLGHFADWLSVPTYKLRRINRLGYTTPIRIGQSLWLSFETVTPEEFHRGRMEYHQGIEEDFYRNFSVRGETSYKVRHGDSIWTICNRRFEIPHWLLKKYNPNKDLSGLIAGEELVVPVVEARFAQDAFVN